MVILGLGEQLGRRRGVAAIAIATGMPLLQPGCVSSSLGAGAPPGQSAVPTENCIQRGLGARMGYCHAR
jgi:hypothetical protein